MPSETPAAAPVENLAASPTTAPAQPAPTQRLVSLDALRGFDMFWIAGGATMYRAFTAGTQNEWLKAFQTQLTHVEWDGFRFLDLIFPLFLFMIGVAIPYSLGKRLARGDSKPRIYGHLLLRLAVLVFFGMMINGNLLSLKPSEFAITYSVLQMLALGYFVASILYLNLNLPLQILATAVLLVGYWAAQTFIPVPGYGPGVYQPGAMFGDWLNNQIFQGWDAPRWRFGWILGISTHASTAMLGVFAGQLLRSARSSTWKVLMLVALGIACLVAGWYWSYSFPIIKNRWTSTFALWAGGWSYLLLALFYLVIDVWQWRRWAFPFVVIGANSIFVYLSWNLCAGAYKAVSDKFLGGLRQYTGTWYEGISWTGAFLVMWLLLWYLHRNKTFIRV
jgi:predicted acyltransferase